MAATDFATTILVDKTPTNIPEMPSIMFVDGGRKKLRQYQQTQ